MKMNNYILCAGLAFGMALTGCGKSGDTGATGGTAGDAATRATAPAAVTLDTSALEKAFASAEAGAKNAVESAVSAVKSADYSGALSKLQGVLGSAKLTPEQETAVKNIIGEVKKLMGGAATDASKAATDLKNALPGK